MANPAELSITAEHATRTRAPARKRREIHRGDQVFAVILRVAAVGLLTLLGLIFIFLLKGAWPAIERFGLSFVLAQTWDPVQDVFGALPVVYGTIFSSLLALAIAAPLSVGIALFLNELAPRRIAQPVGFLIQMLAAIPSVVYGLWGVFVLAPWLRTTVQPWAGAWLAPIPILGALFSGPPYGVGMLAAGIILAIMITPTISSICSEVFAAIPIAQREAALGLGATRWETMRLAVLASARSGILGAVILGLGRALGETMAVTMVIGNRAEISASLFAPAQTMASAIANEYAEASGKLHLASLMEIGLLLFAVTLLINATARFLVLRTGSIGKRAR